MRASMVLLALLPLVACAAAADFSLGHSVQSHHASRHMLQDDNSKIFPEGTDDRLDELAANAGDDEEMSFASLIDEIVYVVKNEVAECENKNFIVCKGCTAEKLEGVTFNEKEQDFEAWCMDAGKFKKQAPVNHDDWMASGCYYTWGPNQEVKVFNKC